MEGTKRGRPKKRPGGDQLFSVRMPTKLHRTLRLICLAKGVALNDVAVEALEGWLAQQPDRDTYEALAEKEQAREEGTD